MVDHQRRGNWGTLEQMDAVQGVTQPARPRMSDDGASSSSRQSGRLQVEAASKRFGQVAALSEVSLSVAAGEFVTILGPSGSGKTTLLKIIAGFETPTREES